MKQIKFINNLYNKIKSYFKDSLKEGDVILLKSGDRLYIESIDDDTVLVYKDKEDEYCDIKKDEIRKNLRSVIGNYIENPYFKINLINAIDLKEFFNKDLYGKNLFLGNQKIINLLNKKDELTFDEFKKITNDFYFCYDIESFNDLLKDSDLRKKYALVKFSDGYKYIEVCEI